MLGYRKKEEKERESSEWRDKWPYQWSSRRSKVKYLSSPSEDFFLLQVEPCGDQERLLANNCPTARGLITQWKNELKECVQCVCVCVYLYLYSFKAQKFSYASDKKKKMKNPTLFIVVRSKPKCLVRNTTEVTVHCKTLRTIL